MTALAKLLDDFEQRANNAGHVRREYHDDGFVAYIGPKSSWWVPDAKSPTGTVLTAMGNLTQDNAALVKALRITTEAINLTLREQRHLADGENCTLIRLKRAKRGLSEHFNVKV